MFPLPKEAAVNLQFRTTLQTEFFNARFVEWSENLDGGEHIGNVFHLFLLIFRNIYTPLLKVLQ